MEQEREAKAKGEVYMPDSALGMCWILRSTSTWLILPHALLNSRLDRTRSFHRLRVSLHVGKIWLPAKRPDTPKGAAKSRRCAVRISGPGRT
jgi:hypothetical protein